jgi:hypothetical protein
MFGRSLFVFFSFFFLAIVLFVIQILITHLLSSKSSSSYVDDFKHLHEPPTNLDEEYQVCCHCI